jgi:hypothetical protein
MNHILNLKVVTNEKHGGVGKVANDRYWSRTVAIDVLFSLLMKMQTGSTNNHIPQIFIVFAAPMYLWDWLALKAAPILMVRYKQWWAKLLRLLTVNSLSYFVKIKY